MVAKTDRSTEPKRSRVKVSPLKVSKETVKDLTGDEAKKVKGGGFSQYCGSRTGTG